MSDDKVELTQGEWRKRLTREQYHLLREKGTEPAFTGKFYKHGGKGLYVCAGCGAELFTSGSKYDSGSGWPSFFEPVSDDALVTEEERSLGMVRVEIMCARCGGHLGHVFPDGPAPTRQRYCVNSGALDFNSE